MIKYFLDRDNDGHWYLIDASFRKEWGEWCDLDSDDEASWDVPEFACALGGNPNQIEFENPVHV